MDHKKFSEFKIVADKMASVIGAFYEAQEEFFNLLCHECDIPLELKDMMLNDKHDESRRQ